MLNIVSSRGNQRVEKQIEDSPNAVRTGVRFALYNIGVDLVKTAEAEMRKPKSGRWYTTKVGKQGTPLKKARRYQASAPGQAPAVVSGNLRRSLRFKVRGWNVMSFRAGGERFGAPYAPFLEEGTANMAARPFMSTAVLEVEKDAINYFEIEIGKQLNKPV